MVAAPERVDRNRWDSPVTIVESKDLISFTKGLVSVSGLTPSSSRKFSIGDTRSEPEYALIDLKTTGEEVRTDLRKEKNQISYHRFECCWKEEQKNRLKKEKV
ncbi:hypothetical protein QYF36_001447 [Acer negundo]|nr:hypothetical protein QYF36_001447 [Acer negundo]